MGGGGHWSVFPSQENSWGIPCEGTRDLSVLLKEGCGVDEWKRQKKQNPDLFARVLFSFCPLLATPRPPLFSAPFRPFLSVKKCSVL